MTESAADRLHELHDSMTDAPWRTWADMIRGQPDNRLVAEGAYGADAAGIAALRNTLPEIEALVRAADAVAFWVGPPQMDELRTALAALREKLAQR
jgi:hypothetical protein